MTTKSKRKNQPRSSNPFAYLWNEFLFSQSFEVETTLSPEECARRLRNLAEGYSDFTNPRGLTGQHVSGDIALNFDFRVRSYYGVTYTAVKARAGLTSIPESGVTLVRGTVKFGWLYSSWLLAIACLVILVMFMITSGDPSAGTTFFCLSVPLWGGMVLFMRQLFVDRSTLLNAIADALDASTEKHKRKRA